MKIGLLDSGIGGLSVLYEAMQKLPNEQFLFYADLDHVPYGEKTTEQVIGYAEEAVRFLIEQGCEAIVIACNTASVAAEKIVRAKYDLPIITMEPAIKKAIDDYGEQKVLIAATPITIRGEKLKNLRDRVDPHHVSDTVALPGLVRLAEAEQFDEEIVLSYLNEALKDYPVKEYASFVLGCTHFNYFKDSYKKIFNRNIHFVDGNEGTVNQLIRRCEKQLQSGDKQFSVEFYYSGRKVEDAKELERLHHLLDRLKQMREIQ